MYQHSTLSLCYDLWKDGRGIRAENLWDKLCVFYDNLEDILNTDWDDIDSLFVLNNAACIMRFSRLFPQR